jgi:hypothetical protein
MRDGDGTTRHPRGAGPGATPVPPIRLPNGDDDAFPWIAERSGWWYSHGVDTLLLAVPAVVSLGIAGARLSGLVRWSWWWVAVPLGVPITLCALGVAAWLWFGYVMSSQD